MRDLSTYFSSHTRLNKFRSIFASAKRAALVSPSLTDMTTLIIFSVLTVMVNEGRRMIDLLVADLWKTNSETWHGWFQKSFCPRRNDHMESWHMARWHLCKLCDKSFCMVLMVGCVFIEDTLVHINRKVANLYYKTWIITWKLDIWRVAMYANFVTKDST